jgi:hypothetical protein
MNTDSSEPEVEPVHTCRYGGHPIVGGSYWTFYREVDGVEVKEYACNPHHTEKRVADYLVTRVLTTGLMTEASLESYRRKELYGVRYDEPYPTFVEDGVTETVPPMWFDEFMDACNRVQAAAKVWEREVWFGGDDPTADPSRVEPYSPRMLDCLAYKRDADGRLDRSVLPKGSLQAFVIPAEYKGYKAEVDGRTYLSHTMCGRSIFQIDEGDDSVGIILDEDSPSARGGIRNIHATAERAIQLIEQATADWKAGRINLVHGDGVGFGF